MTEISDRFILNESKRRSAPASSRYSRISPIGASSALPNETIRWRFPSQSPGRYADFSQSFISFDVKSSALTTGMSVCGAPGFFRTSLVRCAGQHLSSYENYQCWRNLYTKQHVPTDFLGTDGAVMMGTSTGLIGEISTAGTTRSYTDFLSNYAPIFALDKYCPLGTNSPIEWDLTVGAITDNFQYVDLATATAHAAAANPLLFTNLVLHLCVVDVPIDVERSIVSMVGGEFREIVNNIGYSPHFATATNTSFVYNLGLSCSSLSKIDVCFTEPTGINTIPFNVFLKRDLTMARLLVDGSPLLPHGISATSSAIALCMNRCADHSLSDFQSFQLGAKNDYNENGFWISFDCESVARKSSTLRSGLNVSSSTITLELTFGTGLPANLNVHVFSHYDALISCDYSGSKDWEISI